MRDQPVGELWRERLQDATIDIDFAHNCLLEIQKEFAANALPCAGGRFALDEDQ